MDASLSQLKQALLTSSTLDLGPLFLNLLVALLLGLLVAWHFRLFATTLSNREAFARLFPMIVLIMVLIISVVKSSLALALGLVGALSIVRFRTPIKEPEELVYLFMCIAIGLALGAGQTTAAILATVVILTCMAAVKWVRRHRKETGLFLSLDWQPNSSQSHENWLSQMQTLLAQCTESADLRRFDDRADRIEVLYYINVTDVSKLATLVEQLRNSFDNIGVTFLDQKNISGF